MVRLMARISRVLPTALAALDLAHLEWCLRRIDPMHDDVVYILRRIAVCREVLRG